VEERRLHRELRTSRDRLRSAARVPYTSWPAPKIDLSIRRPPSGALLSERSCSLVVADTSSVEVRGRTDNPEDSRKGLRKIPDQAGRGHPERGATDVPGA